MVAKVAQCQNATSQRGQPVCETLKIFTSEKVF